MPTGPELPQNVPNMGIPAFQTGKGVSPTESKQKEGQLPPSGGKKGHNVQANPPAVSQKAQRPSKEVLSQPIVVEKEGASHKTTQLPKSKENERQAKIFSQSAYKGEKERPADKDPKAVRLPDDREGYEVWQLAGKAPQRTQQTLEEERAAEKAAKEIEAGIAKKPTTFLDDFVDTSEISEKFMHQLKNLDPKNKLYKKTEELLKNLHTSTSYDQNKVNLEKLKNLNNELETEVTNITTRKDTAKLIRQLKGLDPQNKLYKEAESLIGTLNKSSNIDQKKENLDKLKTLNANIEMEIFNINERKGAAIQAKQRKEQQ